MQSAGMTATTDAMHALFDMVVGFDDAAPADVNNRAYQTAVPRFAEIGAVTLDRDDDGTPPVVNVAPLLAAAGCTIDTLVRQLAHRMDADREAVIATVREHLDRVLRDDD